MTLGAGRSHDNSDNFENGTFAGRFNTVRDTASWQNDVVLGTNHLLTVGLDYQNDGIDSDTPYTVTSRDDKGLFAQYQGTFGTQDVQLALRGDDNGQFGNHRTGSLAWGHGFANGMRLTTSYGSAFKAPTFNELYYPGFGNPNLQPETSRSLEVGLNDKMDWGRWSLNAYQTRVSDLIAFDASFAPANIAAARIRGLEASVSTQLADWKINTSLTLQNPANQSTGSDNGNILPRHAEQMARLDLDRQLGRYRLGATLFAQGRRFDDLANTQRLGGYATVDLRAEYALARDWTLAARAANLFDKQYETAAYFNQPGRNFFLTLRYQPANH